MNNLHIVKNGILLAGSFRESIRSQAKRFRKPSPCDCFLSPPDKKPCFNVNKISVERGNQGNAKLIKSFLFTHYWPREPSVVGLWMSLDSPYLDVLSEKYCNSGDRFLAFEFNVPMKEKKLVGVGVVNKTFPWMIDELEEWAHFTASQPERCRMYFIAHCLKTPNLFHKYNVNYLYDVEVLGTTQEVAGHGVATKLLRTVLQQAEELRYPLVQVISVSKFASKICERSGMTREWTMKYSDFVDDAGQRVFFPRRPHSTVTVYTKYFDPSLGGREPCKPPFM